MATVTVPQVVPFRKPVEKIPQPKLAHIVDLRRSIQELQAELEQVEGEVQAALESGAPVEPGVLRAFLKECERRCVPWKQVVERELGEEYAKRVLAATRPERYVHLVVTA